MKRKKRNIIFVLIAFVIAILIVNAIDRYQKRNRKPVNFAGTVEALEVNISAEIPGRIVYLGAREGDAVREGEVVLRIDDRELLAEVARARAALEARKRAVEEARAVLDTIGRREDTAQEEIEVARAEKERAEAVLANAEKELERIRRLKEEEFASERDLDRAEREHDEARAALRAAGARVRLAESKLKELASEAQAQKKGIERLKAESKQEEAQIDFFEARLEDTRIASPINGVVVYTAFEQGETAPANETILTVIDPDKLWVRFDMDETYAGRIGVASPLEARAAGMEKIFKAWVTEIGREAGFATERDVTRGRQDIRTFRVQARIEDPERLLKPGMTVSVRVP